MTAKIDDIASIAMTDANSGSGTDNETNFAVPLIRQFVIEPENLIDREGFVGFALGDLSLSVHKELKILDVYRNGRWDGWILGDPVDLDDRAILQSEYRTQDGGNASLEEWIEGHIYRLAGSFVFVLFDETRRRLYLDPCGTLPAVFDRQMCAVGSTAIGVMGFRAYRERLDTDLYQIFEVHRDGWFSGGLTAHRGLERLLANHYLDLSTFEVFRHWPTGPREYDLMADEAGQILSENLIITLRAFADLKNLYIGLTGGNETRAILASCRESVGEFNFVTVDVAGQPVDKNLVKRLVGRFALHHQFLPFVAAVSDQQAVWEILAGHCISGMNKQMHPSVWPLENGFFVGGLGGEIGRGFLWRSWVQESLPTAVSLIDRMKLPRHPLLEERVERRIAELPTGLDPFLTLDLAYLELRLSAWAFSQSHANSRVIDVHPLISRKCISTMLRTLPEERQGNRLFESLVKSSWPQLLDIPINRFGDVRDKLYVVYKAFLNPSRAARKARHVLRTWRPWRA